MGAEQSQLHSGEAIKQNNVGFFINGKEYNVKTDNDRFGPESVLVDFIREKAGLKGTKYMCREGGCGACVVSVKSRDPNSGSEVIRAVNSCLVPVFSADGWDITTVEGLGNKKEGYHDIQQRIVNFSATQCGFCTSGMVMNMFSLSRANPSLKKEEVENAFDGNICRCTGYRPILDAFKSMASDASEELKRKCIDIEDLKACPLNKFNLINEFENLGHSCLASRIYLKLKSGREWIKVASLQEAFEQLERFVADGTKYRIVAGNTETGVYKNDGPYEAYLDINEIPELKQSHIASTTNTIEIGGGITLASAIVEFKKFSQYDGFNYLEQISKHIKRVANHPVRNVATLAGNLMVKKEHKEFPSDIFTLFAAVGAKLKIAYSSTLTHEYTMGEFLELNMNGMIIHSILLPAYKGGQYVFRSFKISRRYQNAHAYVNGGFLFKVDEKNQFTILERPTIVFGGIAPNFVHATQTEEFLNGKKLIAANMQQAMDLMDTEIQPDNTNPLNGSPQYRKTLAQALLYKTIIGILGNSISSSVKMSGQEIERGVSFGRQTYSTDEKEWPLYQPIPKIEAAVQASGEAEYFNDIQPEFGELFGAFVITSIANATLKSVDASQALMIPGVVSFIQAKDVPGKNTYNTSYPQLEEIFISKNVSYAGQSVGLILAETREIAYSAVKKVSITYDNIKTPLIGISNGLKAAEELGELDQCLMENYKTPNEIKKDSTESTTAKIKIKGEFQIGGQYHLSMETQTCICVPREDGLDVYSATQYTDGVQNGISDCLGIPMHDITVMVRRLGGSYGAKLTKSIHVACACAVAAYVLNRPVRIAMDLETNMKMIGKRLPYLTKYQSEVDENGVISKLKANIYCDPGYTMNEVTSYSAMSYMQNCYKVTGWEIRPGKVLTNTHANTYCRAPGTTQGIATIEAIMEHIAHVLGKDPLEVRLANMLKQGDNLLTLESPEKLQVVNPLPQMIEDLKISANYAERKLFVDSFNQTNRFRKRGINLMAMKYAQRYPNFELKYPVFISVYSADGTVAISHAGIEMGQGLNTKCAQTVAKTLNISMDKIRIKASNTIFSPNAGITGGAIGSELICSAAVGACKQLLDKMEPVKSKMKDPTWEKVVAECHKQNILLTSQYQDKPGILKGYLVWGCCLTEVEVDVLTGEYKIVRVDLVEDAGDSLSPEVDIGQIEGAFVMGLGLWTTEKLIWDENTGESLTKNTWEYKPPLSRDIPEDFRVTMLKNRPNPHGVLKSKTTGEPPLCMSVSVLFAMKNAIDSARKDSGDSSWYQLDGPLTPEDIQRLSKTSKSQFTL